MRGESAPTQAVKLMRRMANLAADQDASKDGDSVYTIMLIQMCHASRPYVLDCEEIDVAFALGGRAAVWCRYVCVAESEDFTGWVWVCYTDGQGGYMRVLCDAPEWAGLSRSELEPLSSFILDGLHKQSFFTALGPTGHA